MNRALGQEPTADFAVAQRTVNTWAALAAGLWGTSYVAAKVAVRSVPPLTAAAFRFLVVAVLLWIGMLTGKRWQRVERGDWPWLALAGLLQTTVYFALQYAGIGLTTASNTSVIVNTRPVLVTILSAALLHERLTTRKTSGMLLAFLGVFTLSSRGSLAGLSLGATHVRGDFLIVLNAVSGALGIVVNKKVLAKYRPFPALAYTQTLGAAGLVPLAAVELARLGSFPTAESGSWLLLIYQAVFSTVIAHLFWNRALAHMEASRAAVFIYLAPLVTAVLSHFLLGEAIGIYFVAGALLVLGGALLVTSGGGTAGTSTEPDT
jgi:drug/metabolite transporter (DMT)-like permease